MPNILEKCQYTSPTLKTITGDNAARTSVNRPEGLAPETPWRYGIENDPSQSLKIESFSQNLESVSEKIYF